MKKGEGVSEKISGRPSHLTENEYKRLLDYQATQGRIDARISRLYKAENRKTDLIRKLQQESADYMMKAWLVDRAAWIRHQFYGKELTEKAKEIVVKNKKILKRLGKKPVRDKAAQKELIELAKIAIEYSEYTLKYFEKIKSDLERYGVPWPDREWPPGFQPNSKDA